MNVKLSCGEGMEAVIGAVPGEPVFPAVGGDAGKRKGARASTASQGA